jgi:hypothetical protein
MSFLELVFYVSIQIQYQQCGMSLCSCCSVPCNPLTLGADPAAFSRRTLRGVGADSYCCLAQGLQQLPASSANPLPTQMLRSDHQMLARHWLSGERLAGGAAAAAAAAAAVATHMSCSKYRARVPCCVRLSRTYHFVLLCRAHCLSQCYSVGS